MGTAAAVAHLVGLQAQAPLAPYVGLWSRLAAFATDDLAAALVDRRAVRASLMRVTIHLVNARDALLLRSLLRSVMERGWRASSFSRDLAGIDLEALLTFGRTLIDERPRTRAELAPVLAERWPDRPPNSLVYAITYLLPVVQVPPRGVWGTTGPPAWTTMEAWLGEPLDPAPSKAAVVRRYLGAFGPATVADATAWSGLSGLRPTFEAMREDLLVVRDDAGRELFDLPEGPRPDPDTPAPPRFLAEYDNVLIGHAVRSRIIPPGRRIPLPPGEGATRGTVLVDGMYAGLWGLDRPRDGAVATLIVEPFARIALADRRALEAEAVALIGFIDADREPEVVVREPIG
jgi:hypothetical protein